jgi:hypothetical protein
MARGHQFDYRVGTDVTGAPGDQVFHLDGHPRLSVLASAWLALRNWTRETVIISVYLDLKS